MLDRLRHCLETGGKAQPSCLKAATGAGWSQETGQKPGWGLGEQQQRNRKENGINKYKCKHVVPREKIDRKGFNYSLGWVLPHS